ncbi:MAG: hypothetical protein LBC59_02640 [Chitinispirillales bacterium]|nr:hypothetical protein [Chitinispirillales bacterium]
MSVTASKPMAKKRRASAKEDGFGCPEFSEVEYKEYLKNRSKIHNEVARKNRNISIFDAMGAVDGEFKKKIYGGMSINDMFYSLK